jgi:hypothetical protein
MTQAHWSCGAPGQNKTIEAYHIFDSRAGLSSIHLPWALEAKSGLVSVLLLLHSLSWKQLLLLQF